MKMTKLFAAFAAAALLMGSTSALAAASSSEVVADQQQVRITGPVRLGKHVRRLDRHQYMVVLVQDIRHAATSRWRRREVRPR